MNLSNIAVGQHFKNYKELCLALNEPIKSSDSKIAQLKKWSSFFKFERNGREYIILEIYESPIIYKNYQYTDTNPFSELMYPIIILELHKTFLNNGEHYHYQSLIKYRREFFILFGFMDKHPDLKNLNESEFYILRQFRSDCYTLIYNTFRSACKDLEKFHNLECQERYYYIELPKVSTTEKTDKAENEVDKNDTESSDSPEQPEFIANPTPILADPIHQNIIKSNYDLVLSELKSQTIYVVHLKNQEEEFNNKLNNYLAQYGYRFHNVAYQIGIPYRKESLLKELKHDIKAYYNKSTKDMTESEIEDMLITCRSSINKKMTAKIKEKIIDKNLNLFDQKIDKEIYRLLRKDNGRDKTDNELRKIYLSILNNFVKKFIEIS